MADQATRQKILDGAMKAFSQYGYQKTSIRKIAIAAEIKSSALIYHYFEDKKALFSAVMREMAPVRDLLMLEPEFARLLMTFPPQVVLKQLGSRILTLLEDPEMSNFLKLFVSEAMEKPELAPFLNATQQQILGFLVRYFQYQIDNGTFREHDPEVSACAFVSLILVNSLSYLGFTPYPKPETYIQQVVNIFLDGIRSDE